MNNDELSVWLKKPRYNLRDKGILVDEFNQRLRPFEQPIKMNAVSSPCRLRQVVGSLKKRILEMSPDSS